MKFKTPFKALTTAALIGTLAVSSVAPNAAFAETKAKADTNQQAEFALKEVVLKKGDSYIQVPLSTYTSAVKNKALNGYTVYAVVAQNGTVVPLSVYTAYLKGLQTTTPAVAIAAIADAKKDIEAPADVKPGKVENGQLVPGEETSTEADLKVEEISAINATDANFTVKFGSDVTEADLKDAKLNLKGAQDLTASFVKLDGKTATYKVDTDIIGKTAYNGEYTISSTELKLASGLKTTYSAEVAGTFVEGFVFSPVTTNSVTKDTALEGATVTVDGKSTTTDANGYYKLAVTPGAKTVEISKGNEYFVTEATANVARNNSTVVNEDLEAVDVSKLYFTGTVLDNADSSAVENASVHLQQKDEEGKWIDVAGSTTSTDEDGKFKIGNTGSAATKKLATDVLEVGKEYRAVIEKNISADNLDSVYKTQEVAFTVSNKKAETTKLINVDKVKELKSLKIDASSVNTVIEDAVEIDFLNTDGKELLETLNLNTATGTGVDAVYTTDTDKKNFKEAVDVVDLFKNATVDSTGAITAEDAAGATAVKPRLVAGTYFMKVTNSGNATKAYAVEVTEGGEATVKFEFEKAKEADVLTSADVYSPKALLATAALADTTGNTTTKLGSGDTVTTINGNATGRNDGANGTTEEKVQVAYAAYQTVAGKDIQIADTNATNVTVDAEGKLTSTKATLVDLAGSVTYKVKPTTDFLTGATDQTIQPNKETNTLQAKLDGATKLKTVTVKEKGGSAITSAVKVKSLKLVNDEGKVVAEATPNETTGTLTGGLIDLKSQFGTELASQFANITPDKYKLTVELDGYKAGTSAEVDLIDFQNGNIDVEVEKIKTPKVTGYVRTTDGTNVAVQDADGDSEASIIAYDKNGDAVDAVNFGKNASILETTYTLEKLKAGEEYTFVVRGKGIETKAIKKTVSATDELTTLNFDVVKGGDGQFNFQMVDTKNNPLEQAEVKYAVKDAYANGDKDLGVGKDKSISLTGIDFNGSTEYEVKAPTVNTGTAARSYTINSVSVGSYSLVLADKDATPKYDLPQTYNFTLANINGTTYTTSEGTEIIKVPLINDDSEGALDVLLNLTFAASTPVSEGAVETAANDDIDYIQILDVNGKVVKTVRADENFNTVTEGTTNFISIKVPNNATYTVKTFLDNGFATTDTVTVQNDDINKTITVKQSKR